MIFMKKNKNKPDLSISLIPGRGLFISALAALFVAAGAFFSPVFAVFWIYASAIIVALAVIDAVALFFAADRLQVERKIPASLSLGVTETVKLSIKRSGKGLCPSNFRIFDLFPDSMHCNCMPINAAKLENGKKNYISNGEWVFSYEIKPIERGEWEFSGIHLLISSFFHFWRLKIIHNVKTSGRTYPDFSSLAKQDGIKAIFDQAGLKNVRKRGTGIEFESLREWQSGDSVRAIDWRATSRRQKVIVREYCEEQDQSVLFLLDSGYRLHRQDSEFEGESLPLTQFDFALNAAFLLSWTALKHGDSVSMGIFGNVERWHPPRKGLNAFGSLMNSFYDVKSSGEPSSPFSALENALKRLKRRTFIVLVSNFRKEDEEEISWILPQIARRHLLLLVSMREIDVEKSAARIIKAKDDQDTVLETAQAYAYLCERKALYKKWEHSGILTLESSSHKLSASLINRYLAVKRSRIL
jgi:uncharacterized protein (DUF58 family)